MRTWWGKSSRSFAALPREGGLLPRRTQGGHTHRGLSATFQKDFCAYCIQPGSCPPALEPAEGACNRMQAQDTSQSCSGSVVCLVSLSARALARQWAPAQGLPLLVFQQLFCSKASALPGPLNSSSGPLSLLHKRAVSQKVLKRFKTSCPSRVRRPREGVLAFGLIAPPGVSYCHRLHGKSNPQASSC